MKKLLLITAILLIAGMAFAGGKFWWTCSSDYNRTKKVYTSVCAEWVFQAQPKAAVEFCPGGSEYPTCLVGIHCVKRKTPCNE